MVSNLVKIQEKRKLERKISWNMLNRKLFREDWSTIRIKKLLSVLPVGRRTYTLSEVNKAKRKV